MDKEKRFDSLWLGYCFDSPDYPMSDKNFSDESIEELLQTDSIDEDFINFSLISKLTIEVAALRAQNKELQKRIEALNTAVQLADTYTLLLHNALYSDEAEARQNAINQLEIIGKAFNELQAALDNNQPLPEKR